MRYSTYKVLEEAELNRLYALPIEQLKHENDKAFEHLHRNTGISPQDIEVDRPFYVSNGHYYGVIRVVPGFYQGRFVTEGSKLVLQTSKTEDFRELVTTIPLTKFKEPYLLDIYYLDDEKRYNDIRQVYYSRTVHLYSADPECQHEVTGVLEGGIKCRHCTGWYCA